MAQCLQILGSESIIPGVRYIADGASALLTELVVDQSFTAHAPDDSKYNEYLKPEGHVAAPLWMPFWEMHELEALRVKRVQNVTHEKV